MAIIRFSSPQFRSLPNPSGSGKVGVFFAKASSIQPQLEEWRDVNPREVKATSSIFNGIKATLSDEPDRFAERNRGLTISAESVDYDEKSKEVVVTLENKELHGVVDGGHTLRAVLEVQPDKNGDWPAEVFVKVITGVSAERIADIAGGLNTSQQVDLRSLSNLEGHFEKLKKKLDGQPYAQKIAYRMNEDKEIDVREVLYYLAVFDWSVYKENNHPTALFGRKEGIVRRFAEEASNGGGGSFDALVTRAPEILRLRDLIEQRTAKMDEVRKRKAGKNERVGSKKHRKNPLFFLNDTVDGKVSLGWLMPMLGAFRANVVWDDPKGSFSWKVPVEELLDMCIEGLVRGVLEIHDRENARPEYVGRNATAWRLCYDCVKNGVLEYQLRHVKQ